MESLTSPHLISVLTCPHGESSCPISGELTHLQNEISFLKEQVRTDALTGLYNYRFFADTLPLEMERARRSFQPLSLILLDIDHFKLFNDRWGHELGNQALQHISNMINLTVRKLDFVCRFGGEEFVIILPNTDLRQAANVAERLCEAISLSPLANADLDPISITASLGVDEFRTNHIDTPEEFLARVDAWLYKAKHAGRNCVMGPVPVESAVESLVTNDEKDALFGAFNLPPDKN